MEGRARYLAAIPIALALLASACSGNDGPAEVRRPDILVGAYDFTESNVLAHIYARALRAAGFDAGVLEGVATREIMEPALEQARVDVVPEYQGTLTRFLEATSGGSPDAGQHVLEALLADRDLEGLAPAPAQNENVIVVTRETASELGLKKISDLRSVSTDLTFGGPPECPARPLCLRGLEQVYGLTFKQFQPLDVGGPLTVAALEGNEIDVGLLFNTDPRIEHDNLVVLRDNRHLQPAENILPVVRSEVLEANGEAMSDALDQVSVLLSTATLRELNGSVDDEGRPPEEVAAAWLSENGVTS